MKNIDVGHTVEVEEASLGAEEEFVVAFHTLRSLSMRKILPQKARSSAEARTTWELSEVTGEILAGATVGNGAVDGAAIILSSTEDVASPSQVGHALRERLRRGQRTMILTRRRRQRLHQLRNTKLPRPLS